MLRLDGVTKDYGRSRVLKGISLEIPRGQFVGIVGRSGAGKSTLLRAINRLDDPTSGRILWGDEDVTAYAGWRLRDWRRRCAMIFQQFNLVGRLDVLDNVLMGRLAHAPSWRSMTKMWDVADRTIALCALEQMDIAPLAAQRAETLSGGQQQRVAICRALVQEPEIILADEPIASLDPKNTRVVMDALARINREFGLTVICNLHSLEIARAYCDRLIGVQAGHVVFDDIPEALDEPLAQRLYGMEAASLPGTDAAPVFAAA